jgi:copper resistance protein B
MKCPILIFALATACLHGGVLQAASDAHAGHQGMQHGEKASIPANKSVAGPHAMHPQTQDSASVTPVPEPTDAERAVAFPDVGGMDPRKMMDTPVMLYALLDQFEWVDSDAGSALSWAGKAWLGNDVQRLWLRSEGRRGDCETDHAELQVLYGRPFARWWDWVAGIRHDFKPGPSQTWLGAGVQGLAPYWFETEANLYVGESGQSNLRLEVEYELLLSQRLVLQPLLELNIFGKDDEQHGIGSGLANTELGLRLRYEIRREIAPYIGLSWERSYGETADLARLHGEAIEDTSLVAGIRLWY